MTPGSQSAPADTRQVLLQVATRAFAERGYEGASLRQICSDAGLTTGAVYFFFKGKEDLFRAVVAPLVEPLRALLADDGDTTWRLFLGSGAHGELSDSVRDFVELCYEHDEIRRAVVSSRGCAVMESVFDELSGVVFTGLRRFLLGGGSSSGVWDDFALRLLSRGILCTLIEILARDESADQACRHVGNVSRFVCAGIEALCSPPDSASA